MRIAQIAPLWERVPPPAYGGTEAVVHLLVEGLVRRGHEVVLFASGDSRTSAELRSVYPESLRTARELKTPGERFVYDILHSAIALCEARDCDVIHNHSGEIPMAMSLLGSLPPMLTTLHCQITPHTRAIWERYRGYYNAISRAAHRNLPEFPHAKSAGVVYNAIDVRAYPFCRHKEDYFLFLSRIAPEKGPHLAVEAARRAGARLLMAGKVDAADVEFYEEVVRPLVDGYQIEYVGEVTRDQTKALYGQARALLLPLQWEEPFGLVMAEALACGTPVIAFRRGSAPEIVRHGETGFIVENVDGMVAAMAQVDRIDPGRCREDVEARFDESCMVNGYLTVFQKMLREEGARRPTKVFSVVDVDLRANGLLGIPSPEAIERRARPSALIDG